ncbi:MAG: polyribonucleotide nucleotidyltransferase [Candidatus Parcubacteria bacterium]|nr:MAG: polyribonucleotide nucleotidyltransferase [Candidatus Parcubacteria bacterium]
MDKKFIYQSLNYEVEFILNDWAERSLISVITKSRDTLILTVVNVGKEIPESDFLPLTIDYEEKFYAGGKIFGSRFIRREGKPTLTSILNSRLIDRSIRPAFSSNFRYQIHIVNTLLSYDPESDPALLALLGTSFALSCLDLEWLGPIAGVRLGYDGQNWIINPKNDLKTGLLAELFIAGTKNKINMIEFEGKEIEEKNIVKGIDLAFEEIKKINDFIQLTVSKLKVKFLANQKDQEANYYLQAEKILDEFLEKNKIVLKDILFSNDEGDKGWQEVFSLLNNEDFSDKTPYVFNALQKKFKKVFQETVLKEKLRPDGRQLNELRKISAEIDVLPRVHGSALFKRGLTHILSTLTLAGPGEELILREIEYEGSRHFIHHYNFPSYSVGELGSNRGPSRREIGHGELAEKALRNLIPSQDEFPYTIRLVSEVLSSNGSTSMGAICASSLALMSGGVPFEKHVAGISIGMVYEDDDKYELLTDIQGPEDFFGAMDFKVAGTRQGVTAIQCDVKIEGLNKDQIEKALIQAKEARFKIIDYLDGVISQPRKKLSPFAPKVEILKIDSLKIGLVIGSGGRTINDIINSTNTKIDINQDGVVYITGDNLEDVCLAKNWIKIITDSLKVGEIIKGKVIKILPFGAIIELAPQKTAFLHISEIADKKIENIESEIRVGDEFDFLVKNISEDGKIYLSLKNARRK